MTTPKEPGAVGRSRYELMHMPFRSWCFSCVAGRGADDPLRKSDGYSGPPRVECDFMFMSSRVHLASPGLTIFNMTDRESRSMAAALSVKDARDLLVRFFLAMLDAWGRSDFKVLLRSDHEVTLTLILHEEQARRQQGTLVERTLSGKPRDHGSHGKSPPIPGRCHAQRSMRLKRELEAGWRRTIHSSAG